MCLFVNKPKCSVAERDITVYKYVAKRARILEGKYAGAVMHEKELKSEWWKMFESETIWVSPYNTCNYIIYKPGENLTDPMFQDTTEHYTEGIGFKVFNGLHTFARSRDAVLRAEIFADTDGGSGVLECVIPKGTRYWVNEDCDEYCSESLEIRELVCQFLQ